MMCITAPTCPSVADLFLCSCAGAVGHPGSGGDGSDTSNGGFSDMDGRLGKHTHIHRLRHTHTHTQAEAHRHIFAHTHGKTRYVLRPTHGCSVMCPGLLHGVSNLCLCMLSALMSALSLYVALYAHTALHGLRALQVCVVMHACSKIAGGRLMVHTQGCCDLLPVYGDGCALAYTAWHVHAGCIVASSSAVSSRCHRLVCQCNCVRPMLVMQVGRLWGTVLMRSKAKARRAKTRTAMTRVSSMTNILRIMAR